MLRPTPPTVRSLRPSACAHVQFQDGARWFQSLLLLAPLVGTGLHVPYHLIVAASLGASLLSMHIFVHASRFGAPEGFDGDGTSVLYGNLSSQLALGKPSTSSSTRVSLCATPRSPRLPMKTASASAKRRAARPMHSTHGRGASVLRGCRRYQLVPIGLSLTLAAFFKLAELNGFIELDRLARQLRTPQVTAMATALAKISKRKAESEGSGARWPRG